MTTPSAAAGSSATRLAVVTRGGAVESEHLGHVAVVRRGDLVLGLGDPGSPVFTRSAIKPLQALPLFDRGIVARLALTDEELAIVCASHDGTPLHTEAVDAVLRKGGLARDHLGCGPHAPLDRDAAAALAQQGQQPGRVHNNCSGKHAGFLLLAADCGTPLADYLEPASTAQQLVRAAVADMAGLPPAAIGVAVDGCGAPTLRMPLVALAGAFARLTNPAALPPARRAACERLLAAVSRAPLHLGGRAQLGSALLAAAPGRVFPKNGAEAVYAVGVAGLDVGIAIKIADGAARACPPVIVELLRRFGPWRTVPDSLADFARVPVRNTLRAVVGHVESVLP